MNAAAYCKFRKAPSPNERREVYATLRVPGEVMQPVKTWRVQARSDEKTLSYRKHSIRPRLMWKFG